MRRWMIAILVAGLLPLAASGQDVSEQETKEPLEILLFVSQHCGACIKVENEVLPPIKEHYGDAITITRLDIADKTNYENLVNLMHLYSREVAYPVAYAADRILVGTTEIRTQLPRIIEKYLYGEIQPQAPPSGFEGGKTVEQMFSEFSVPAVVLAGLIDGINPCAFTVIVFFISFLAVYGYRRREMVLIGTGYIAAVFCAYLAIGLGLFQFLYAMQQFHKAMVVFYFAVGSLCVVLAVLCLVDYVRFKRTGEVTESFLQLPALIKKRIRGVIGDQFRERKSGSGILRLLLGAFSVGVLVSLLEAVCTGQIYLPVISFVMRDPDMRIKALAYLILYNFMFIVPLVLVFGAALWGATSQHFATWYRERYGLVRLLMALLFIVLAFLMTL
jgi:cytochrome c biogenesis protein CcdA